MAYFENIPNLKYPYFGTTQSSSDDTILTKNIFRRAKLREDFLKYYTYSKIYIDNLYGLKILLLD